MLGKPVPAANLDTPVIVETPSAKGQKFFDDRGAPGRGVSPPSPPQAYGEVIGPCPG